MKNKNYLKNEKNTIPPTGVLIFLLVLILAGLFVVKAEDNKTTQWNTQLVYDNVNACYQGTYRWILMANPALIGKSPQLLFNDKWFNIVFVYWIR
jgi:hypothetical protein